MSTPIILLSGQAGSGKDTVASFLVKKHDAVSIALADPMKRFVLNTFGFTTDQLWGPSSARNELVQRFVRKSEREQVRANVERVGYGFIAEVAPELTEKQRRTADRRMQIWARNLLEGVEVSGGLTARKVLQTFGTEWGRKTSRDMWINYGVRTAKKLLGGGYRYGPFTGLVENEIVPSPSRVVITDGRFRNEIVEILAVGGKVWKIVTPDLDTKSVDAAGVAGHKSETEQQTIPDHFFSAILHNDKAYGLGPLEAKVDALVRWTTTFPFVVSLPPPPSAG